MKKIAAILLFTGLSTGAFAQFSPAAGKPGSTAIYKDSAVFIAWATNCSVVRGLQDMSNKSLIYASVGDSSMVLGKAGENGVVSLGDGGYAIVKFDHPVANGPGWDFAVFENSFSDNYLELAFVEVSSDGINYFRFPCTSLTDTSTQVDGFGELDPTKIDNLAGKFRALYGTPFDLQQLATQPGLNVNSVTHIKIKDAIGSIRDQYANRDQYGHKINDPWPTNFPSSGFDLDAVGVIHSGSVAIKENNVNPIQFYIYPNPLKDKAIIQLQTAAPSHTTLVLTNSLGKVMLITTEMLGSRKSNLELNFAGINSGIYFLTVVTEAGSTTKKIIISND